jgi:gliding motility-associated protein GldC
MSKEKSQINIDIILGENQVPETIRWSAPDQDQFDQQAKAMLLSFFDRENRETLKIDLWTRDMQVGEMDRFFYQTLRALVDTYFKATNNQALARAMQQFVQYFGEQTEIIPKSQ